MPVRRAPAKLCVALFLVSLSTTAFAQTKPRFVVAVDTSGSMRYDLAGDETNGDGVGRLPLAGDNAQRKLDGVYYGCGGAGRPGTGAGVDMDGDCFPNDSRIWIAKDAIRKMILAYGDVEWALSRFTQTDSSEGIVNNADYDVDIDNGTCSGSEGACTNTYDDLNYRGICCGSGFGCSPVVAGGGQMLVGFPGVAGQAFATIDNRPSILRWMDNVETAFHVPTATDISNVDRCDHAHGNDCELRIPPNGNNTALTPLGGLIRDSGTYLTATRNADASNACRQYSIILVTDGAETCNTNPNQRAFELAYPNQGTCNPASIPAGTPTIRTYVVGVSIDSGEQSSLNQIAACGGTTSAHFANSPTELSAALSAIVAESIKFETCDGLDNDCDQKIDEDIPFGQPGTAPQPQALFCDGEARRSVTQNNQVRARTDIADNFPQSTPISQSIVCGQVNDTCSHAGFDDDCDGKMDENDANLTACGTCPGAPDICDGLDNDCDGKFDEGVNSGVQFSACPTQCTMDVPCGSDVGTCVPGVYRCVGGVLNTSTCQGATGPTTEVCDEKDNNCNGIVDDPALLQRNCTTPYGNVGICKIGIQYCAKPSIGEKKDGMGYHVDGNGAPVCEGQVLPEDRELCDNLDHDCNGNNFTCTQNTCVIGPQPAFVGNSCGSGIGICKGTLQCNTTANPPALVCNAPSAGTETCNNIDDDCDGSIDEDAIAGPDLGGVNGGAANAFCGTETRIAGVCNPGHFACVNGHWQCRDEVGPATEICNGADDDCDGMTDEPADVSANDPRIGQQCGTDVGECSPGFSSCMGGNVVCTPVQGPVDEICDGKDNDCDYLTDENLPDDSPKDGVQDVKSCGTTTGLCEPGLIACTTVATSVDPDGHDFTCVGGVGPVPEICDGEDNDCDGDVDECAGTKGSPAYNACKNDALGDLGAGGGQTCGSNVAPCSPGKTKCVADADGMGHPGFVCVGAVNGMSEICNGADDDCDTKIDEDLDPVNDPRLGQRCDMSVVGACRIDVDHDNVPNDPDDAPCGQCRFGLQECVLGAIDCVGSIGPSMYERCNNSDDDCDDKVDECVDPDDDSPNCAGEIDPNTPVGTMCGNTTGECKQGTNSCENGVLVCKDRVGVVDEVCNNKDDDCDHNVDEGLGKGTPCGSSVGECRTGTMVCAPDNSGGLVCNGGQGPSDEECNGLDDDCDGKTDEGLGLGEPCGSDEGACSKGKLECQNGHTVCSGEKGPTVETCDCEDNDCDGKVDETSSAAPICPGSAACIMCQCALPCAPTAEFSAECPQGKAAIEDHDECFCVGEQCRQLDCQKQTITVSDDVQCAPDSDLVGTCLCKNNECTFRCAGVTCENNLICDPTDGRCKQRSCLLPQFRCPDDKRCQLSASDSAWDCVDDPCADKKCASDEACRDGVCFKSCANVTCSKGNACKDGTCVVDHCSGVQCDPGKVCNPKDGKCVSAGACVGTGCADGQVCDRVSGMCDEDPCLSTHCPYAQQCNKDTFQCEPRCFGNLLFCDDTCVNPMTSHDHCGASDDCRGENAGDTCKAGLVCSRGKCSETCADNLLNCGGECIDPATDRDHCGAKSDCKDKNDGVVCKDGTECIAGTCKAFDTNGGGGKGDDTPDGTRVIAAGGGGCACSVPGTPQGASGSQRGLLSLLLFAFGGAVLMRRRRPRAARFASQLLLLALASIGLGLFGSGCKVDTFCLDCPPKGEPNTNDMSDGGSAGGNGGGGGNNAGGGGSGGDVSVGGGTGGMNGGGGGSGGTGTGGTGAGGDGGSQCGLTEICNGQDDDCDGKIDEDTEPAASGIDVKNDPNNCGKCGTVCALQHAFNACKKGECAIDTKQGDDGCDVGYHNLDKKDANGCEYHCTKTADDDSLCDLVDNDCDNKIDENVDFKGDPDNCGGCGFRCAPNHAANGGVCEDGQCTLDDSKCDTGFTNLDDKPSNGCEYPCPVFPTVGELCNFLDDDCDGKVDEETQVADSARIGIACGTDEGECVAGTYICKDGAPFCMGSVGPSQEVCDGLDNDCDGDTDVDDPEVGIPCGEVTPGSQCSKGTLQIPASGCSGGVVKQLECLGGQGPVAELCNGLDDDCDGKADETENGLKPQEGQKCTNGSNGLEIVTSDPPGLCEAGDTKCESGHLVCRNEVAPETTELCDNKDHDCDGKTMADFTPDVPNGTTATSGPDPRVGKNCGIDTGECSFGVQTCHLDTMMLSCDGRVDPVAEICDGKDNDCDGKIDEHTKDNNNVDIPLAGEGVACITNSNGTLNTNPPSTASRGHCETGTTVCSAGKIGCSGQIGPLPELCDAEDWDCDGNANNNVSVTDPAIGKPCGPPTVGVCKTGTTTCNGSSQVVCTGAMPSSTYVPPAQNNTKETACDGLDNDCDGATDEGTAASYDGATCCDITGFSCCDAGTRQCKSGRIQCVYPVGAKFPKAEVCGGGDDDCDTKTDEGFNTQTDVNNCGTCGTQCKFNGGVTNGHSVLVCDTGNCKIGACDTGFADANHNYLDGCEAACTFTGNEVCDNTDNDCDGTIDNVQSIPSAVCIPKKTGVCDVPELLTQGPKCTSGALTCDIQSLVTAGKISNYQATETLCDGKDNDCDGKIDEGFNPPVGQVCHKGQGACQTNGVNVCNGTGASICNAATPGGGSTEICNGVDDDCDGTIDDFAPTLANPVGNIDFVDLGDTTGHTLVMAFEASHPDSATTNRSTSKVCSVEGAPAWNNVTWDEARSACCTLNANGTCAGDGQGWRLCDSSTWDFTCRGPGSSCNWGYSNAVDNKGTVTTADDELLADCDHDPRDPTFAQVCAGAEALHDGMWSCPVGTNECSTVTGSGDFPECRTVWSDGDVFDMSGNLQEWTNTAQGTGIHEIRGGSYNDVENGRTCDFNFVVGNTTFRFPNTGFRCCWYPPVSSTCTTFDSGVTAAAPVNATVDSGDTNSTVSVSGKTGTITAVRLLDATGNHGHFSDLTFSLRNPGASTSVQMVNSGNCNTDTNWAFDIRDDATNTVQNGNPFCAGSSPVGGSVANAYKPQSALTAFNGQTANGTWTLRINDNNDRGSGSVGNNRVQITGWKLEICTQQYAIP